MTGITIPTSPAELAELLNDGKRMAAVFKDKDLFKEFITNYAKTVAPIDGDIAAQVREQTQLVVAEMLGTNGSTPPVNLAAGDGDVLAPILAGTLAGTTKKVSQGRGAVYNRASPGAGFEVAYKAEERFSSIGEYCQAIREEARPSSLKNRAELLRKLENVRQFQNSFGSEVPGDGGFLIPEIMRSELLQLALEAAIVRSRATVIPMSTLRVPIPTVDDTSHVSSLFGGVVFYWTEESAALTESQASFGRVTLDAKKLTGFFKVPNELLSDAPAFSGWFDTRIPAGLAWAEDVAFLSETGAGTPLGVVGANNPAYVQVDRAATGSLAWADIVNMYARMLPTSLSSAIWVCAIDTFPQIAQLSLSTPGIWMGGYNAATAADSPPVTIMGRPVIFTEKVGPANSVGDINFLDLSYYLIGDRQAVAVAASDQFAFQNDQTCYRIIERVDGRPWLQSPLTPHNGSTNTLSAYVGLSATHT